MSTLPLAAIVLGVLILAVFLWRRAAPAEYVKREPTLAEPRPAGAPGAEDAARREPK